MLGHLRSVLIDAVLRSRLPLGPVLSALLLHVPDSEPLFHLFDHGLELEQRGAKSRTQARLRVGRGLLRVLDGLTIVRLDCIRSVIVQTRGYDLLGVQQCVGHRALDLTGQAALLEEVVDFLVGLFDALSKDLLGFDLLLILLDVCLKCLLLLLLDWINSQRRRSSQQLARLLQLVLLLLTRVTHLTLESLVLLLSRHGLL